MFVQSPRIRPLAICMLRRASKFLVQEFKHEATQQHYYRPLGGGIEFGELGQDTIRREMQEELNIVVTDIHYETTLENIFTYIGRASHEIVLVYSARFADESLYEQEEFVVTDGPLASHAVWRTLDFFKETNLPLYPNGLPQWLETWLAS